MDNGIRLLDLREVAHRLRGVDTAHIAKCVVGLADAWHDEKTGMREELLAASPYSPANTAAALDPLFRRVTMDNLRAWMAEELGSFDEADRMLIGPEVVLHVCAGTVPNAMLVPVFRSWLLKSASAVKPGRALEPFTRTFIRMLRTFGGKLAGSVALIEWPQNRPAEELHPDVEDTLSYVDAVLVFGDDETVDVFKKHASANMPVFDFGHRYSVTVIARERLTTQTTNKLAAACAQDVAICDTQGCLSPQVIFIETGGDCSPEEFTSALAVAMQEAATEMPIGPLSAADGYAIAAFRARISAHENWQLSCSPGSMTWTIAGAPCDHGPVPLSGLPRVVTVKPIDDIAGVAGCIRATMPGKLQGVAMAAPLTRCAHLVEALSEQGASYFCKPGQLQDPPLTWNQDGVSMMRKLLNYKV